MIKNVFYDWGGGNIALFHAINDVRGETLDRVMLFATRISNHVYAPAYLGLVALIAVYLVTHRLQHDREGGHALALQWFGTLSVFSIAYSAGAALVLWLKSFLDFPRPPLALPAGTVHILGAPEYHHSLPSGHTFFAAVLAASVWPRLDRRWRIAVVAFVLWVGLSRISVGAHFPADIVASYLVGIAVVALVRIAIDRALRGRSVGAPSRDESSR